MELLDISTVKSKNLPIVLVEDIPMKELMPNFFFFISTLPKDFAVFDSLDKNKYLDMAEIWSY